MAGFNSSQFEKQLLQALAAEASLSNDTKQVLKKLETKNVDVVKMLERVQGKKEGTMITTVKKKKKRKKKKKKKKKVIKSWMMKI